MTLEACWLLADVAVVDIKDSPDAIKAFKIVKHPDVYVYKLSTDEEKRSWLAAIKKAANDYLLYRRNDRETVSGAGVAQRSYERKRTWCL